MPLQMAHKGDQALGREERRVDDRNRRASGQIRLGPRERQTPAVAAAHPDP
jgi:hypothetical protein